MSRIDVEHRAEGVSLTLADQWLSMSVELTQAETDDLVKQLVLQGSAPTHTEADSQI